MGKTLIKIDCLDQRLIVASAPTLASGGKNENEVEFNFCEKWNGFEKVAVFYRDVKDPYKSTIDGIGRCVVPWEVLTSDGYIFIGVFGVKDDITRTSEILRYKIKLGAITEDLKPSDPTPELWEQILAGIADKVNVKQGVEHAGKVLGIDEEGNVTPVIGGGSGAILDPTLSKENQAAEAKAVGEALVRKVDAVEGMGLSSNDYTDEEKLKVEQNKTDIENLDNDLNAFEKDRPFNLTGNPVQVETFEGMPLNPITVLEPKQSGSGDPYPAGGKNLIGNWEQGAVNSKGEEFSSATVIRSALAKVSEKNVYVTVPEGFAYFFVEYAAGVFVNRTDRDMSQAFTLFDSTTHIRLCLVKNDGGNIVPSEAVGYQVEYGTVGTEVVPFENIRPFIGYDKLGLTGAGKNLCPYVQHNEVAALRLFAGRTYVVSIADESASDITLLLYSDGIGQTYNRSVPINRVDGGRRYGVFTLSADVTHVNFTWGATSTLIDPQIEENSVATSYEPYQGKTYTVQISRTVYGFRYEWLTGKGWIEWIKYELDGTEDVSDYGSRMFLWIDNSIPYAADRVPGTGFCSHGAYDFEGTTNTRSNFAVFVGVDDSTGHYLAFGGLYSAFDSLDTFKAYLAAQKAAGTPVQIVYKLATPVEIQLEPHEINALQGVNTLYGDGEITISGRSDMQAVVSNLLKKIAMLENKLNESTLSGESE